MGDHVIGGDRISASNPLSVAVQSSASGALSEATFTDRVGERQASPTANTVLDRLKALLTGIILAAGEAHIGAVGGDFTSVAVEVTKTGAGDTTAYTAKDVFNAAVGAGLTFANLARVTGGSGVIVKARIATDQKTNTARWRLHLWKTAPTFINDNSPFLYLYANEANYVGYIDFDAMATEDASNSTAAFTQKVGTLLPFVCGATASLFGELETLDAFTPASAQKVTVTLTADRN